MKIAHPERCATLWEFHPLVIETTYGEAVSVLLMLAEDESLVLRKFYGHSFELGMR